MRHDFRRTLAALVLIASSVALAPGKAIAQEIEASQRPADGARIESVSQAELEREAEQRAAYREVLDRRIDREGRDDTWSKATEESLWRSLGEVVNLDFAVRDLRCGRTLCRLVLGHDTMEGQEASLMETAGRPGFELEGIAHLEWSESTGQAVSYVYVLQDGASWPPETPAPR